MTTTEQIPDDLRRRLVNLRFGATVDAVRDALLTVDATLAAAGAADDLRTRAQIALAEACNNIVEHAYQPPCDSADAVIVLDIAGDPGGLQITLRDKGRGFLVITHYQRLLDHIRPDVVHIMSDGRIIQTGGPELALEVEERGYEHLKEEAL